MSINRIFKREVQRQIKQGVLLKRQGVKNIILPFIIKPNPSKHIHPRRLRELKAFLKKYPGIARDIYEPQFVTEAPCT